MGKCSYCRNSAGLFRNRHQECEAAYQNGRISIVARVADAASCLDFDKDTLSSDLSNIAAASFIGATGIASRRVEIDLLIEEGWSNAVQDALSDGILTEAEEIRLCNFREQLNVRMRQEKTRSASLQVQSASQQRLLTEARKAAISLAPSSDHLCELETAFKKSMLTKPDVTKVLAQAWEDAVAEYLKDGVLSLVEENSLLNYLRHFQLTPGIVNRNGAYKAMVQFAVLREASEGKIPDRLGDIGGGPVPFNLVKSERLIWATENVAYYELKTHQEWRGTSYERGHSVARGHSVEQGYSVERGGFGSWTSRSTGLTGGAFAASGSHESTAFSQSTSLSESKTTSQSRLIEWEETERVDTGLLGVTSEHLYFYGNRHRFRIPYGHVVAFESVKEGIVLTQDNQGAKPQSFRTSDAWFIYRLASILAQR